MSMNPNSKQLADFEQDNTVKRWYIPFSHKWKSWLYVAPAILLFMSIFSMLYLLKIERLLSWYTVPYFVLFVVATIWFKAVRKHLTDNLLKRKDMFQTAFAYPLLVQGGKVFALASTGQNRHNASFVKHQAALTEITEADVAKMKVGRFYPQDTDNQLGILCIRKFSIRRWNARWTEKDLFPVMLVEARWARVIR